MGVVIFGSLAVAVFSFRRRFKLALAASLACIPGLAFSQEPSPKLREAIEEMKKPFLLELDIREKNSKFLLFNNAVRAYAVSYCVGSAGLVEEYLTGKAYFEWLNDNNSIRLAKKDLSRMTNSFQFMSLLEHTVRNVGCDNLIREDMSREGDSIRPYLLRYLRSDLR